jgi:uncharacterized membrane protein YkvA (DUF1232 family)
MGDDGRLGRWKARAKELQLETHALVLAARDRRTPWYAKALAVAIVGYALSPIDLIPDFIPVLGYLDDLVIIPAGLALVLKMVPGEVMDECRARAREIAADGTGRHWVAAAAVVGVWVLLLALVALAIARMAATRR